MATNIKIREATGHDLAWLMRWMRQATDSLGFLSAEALAEKIHNRHMLVAMVGKEPVGFVLHGAFTARPCPIHMTYVAPQWRKQGAGRKLIESLLEIAAVLGVPGLVARVAADLPASGFWERIGFVCSRTTSGGASRSRGLRVWEHPIGEPAAAMNQER